MSTSAIGLDIGGANLKYADTAGRSRSVPFPLWKSPDRLGDEVRTLVASANPNGSIETTGPVGITMTGELCDCFPTKRIGVERIARACRDALGEQVRFWGTDGRFHLAESAVADPLRIASANWHAAATWVARTFDEPHLLWLDVGSTTTDIIPICDGRPTSVGRDDVGRMDHQELIYTGASRTPLGSLMPEGAAEYFATTRDLGLVLRHLPESPSDVDTADGMPADRSHALTRIARMLCGDAETVEESRIVALAEDLHQRQVRRIAAAVRLICERPGFRPQRVVISGSGEFLARSALTTAGPGVPVSAWSERFGDASSSAIAAVAVAHLSMDRKKIPADVAPSITTKRSIIAKIGGSLFDLPDLAERIRRWIAAQDGWVTLIAGGGSAADVVREMHRTHRLTESAAHALAIGMMAVNARMLSEMLGLPIVARPACRFGGAILDPQTFLNADERSADPLPHAWNVTSDSIAAHVTARTGVHRPTGLALLKSRPMAPATDWHVAAEMGLVDSAFPDLVARHRLAVEWVDLRSNVR